MDSLQLENLITIVGAVLATAGLGGVAWLAVTELRLRAVRRTRLAVAGGAPVPAADKGGITAGVIGDQVMTAVRRLGQQSAVRDPAIQVGATECSTCKIQMEQGVTKPTIHPVKMLALSYGLMPELESLLTARSEELIVT